MFRQPARERQEHNPGRKSASSPYKPSSPRTLPAPLNVSGHASYNDNISAQTRSKLSTALVSFRAACPNAAYLGTYRLEEVVNCSGQTLRPHSRILHCLRRSGGEILRLAQWTEDEHPVHQVAGDLGLDFPPSPPCISNLPLITLISMQSHCRR